MLKASLFIYLIILSTTIFAQEVKVTFTDLLVLGKDAGDQKEYLFVRPYKIRTDSKNNIYYQEIKQGPNGNEAMINMYSAEGKFIATLGQLGAGPGDFKRIADFILSDDDKVLIVDDWLHRITVYDSEKKKFEVLGSINPPVVMPEMYLLGQNRLLFVDNLLLPGGKNLLYIKSFDMKTTYYDFGHPSVFINSTDPLINEKIKSGISPLSVCVINENKIAAVPISFDGELTLLTFENKEWKSKRFTGFKPKYNSLEMITPEDLSERRKQKEIHASWGSGSTTYLQHSCSSRIFTYKNRYILHFFSVCQHPSTVNYYIDVFDMDGRYLGNTLLYKREAGKKSDKMFTIFCKDKDDNFYISQELDGLSVIKKVKIDITF